MAVPPTMGGIHYCCDAQSQHSKNQSDDNSKMNEQTKGPA